MKRKAILSAYSALILAALLLAVFTFNQVNALFNLLETLHPFAGLTFLLIFAATTLLFLAAAARFFWSPNKPGLPDHESSKEMGAYITYMTGRMRTHPMHPDPRKKEKDLRWVRTNLKLAEVDALNTTKQLATKNFFVGAFAQNTSYGTTTSLLNNIRVLWTIYSIHNREQHLMEFISLVRAVYGCLPLSDFRKEEIPAHIQPIIQSAFSNTLSSLLPAGNLLTPFFLNLFLAGATNTYLTCLSGIIAMHQSQIMTEEDKKEIVAQSIFEASFMLKEIVRECNPVLSVTISKAVKKAGIESLDTMPSPSLDSGLAQGIVSHLASSLKSIIKETAKE
ncbi:MAG: hypothetical protein WCH05_02085 [Chlorobiaceae bacterium]